MAYEIARVFAKRETEKSDWSGRIGNATLFVSDDGIWTLNGKVLSRKSIEYLLMFSLQSLQDAYAGATDLGEARANFDKKTAALMDGTIGMRGTGADEETKIARKLVLAKLVAKYGKDSEESKKTPEQLDAIFEKNREKLAPVVAAEIARLEKARKERAEMENAIEALDI